MPTQHPPRFIFTHLTQAEWRDLTADLSRAALPATSSADADRLLARWLTRTAVPRSSAPHTPERGAAATPMRRRRSRHALAQPRGDVPAFLRALHAHMSAVAAESARFERAAYTAFTLGGDGELLAQIGRKFSLPDLKLRLHRLHLAAFFGWTLAEIDAMTATDYNDALAYLAALATVRRPDVR